MSKARIRKAVAKVKRCFDCPHAFEGYDLVNRCYYRPKYVREIKTPTDRLPSWCPLPDWKEEEK